jgi:hypothetical protein
MKLQLQEKLKLGSRPPSPFFKLSRDSILEMQKPKHEPDKVKPMG